MASLPAKLPRNMFKCFQCREIFTQRDGAWIDWNSIQVHLCHSCDKQTENREERESHRAAGKP